MSGRSHASILAAVVVITAVSVTAQQPFSVEQTLKPSFSVAGVRLVDVDGDGAHEVIVVGDAGEVRTYGAANGAVDPAPRGALTLPHPAHTVMGVASMTPARTRSLVTVTPRGIIAYEPDESGAFATAGTPMSPTRGRRAPGFKIRVGAPRFAPVCQDMNGDGRVDVLVPVGDKVELWINGGSSSDTNPNALPRLRRAARLPVKVRRRAGFQADRLSDELESSFTIPRVQTADLNGDGRDDLIVEDGRRRAYHLQKVDGSIPVEPDVTLDLSIFRDTTPKATVRPGRTLAGGDRQTLQSRDLNGDGIPDYVIAHRRKVWVFHGRKGQGPQFTDPVQILRSADDVTTLALMDLQPDGHPDLVVIKVQVPSVSGLLVGALGALEVELTAVGYASKAGDGFETKPKWKSEITVELPSIVSIMKNPYAIIRRFEEAGAGFEATLDADFDGDGKPDIAVLDQENRRLRLWRGAKNPRSDPKDDPDALLRGILFEDKDKTWDLDRLVDLVGKVAKSHVGNRTGGRDPDLEIPLRKDGKELIVHVRSGDVDGDGKAEFVVGYRDVATTVLEVIGVR